MTAVLAAHEVDVLIPIGGEGTLTAAHLLSQAGVPVVGIPKTIDNDIDGTDLTFGFDTAVSIATEMIDRLHTTARSEEHTSELQSRQYLVCRLLLEKKNI